ncbi:MAG: MFS transporter [Magnetococcales bacterium]|nr:MFS transporter [Magnetococcales bacterium]
MVGDSASDSKRSLFHNRDYLTLFAAQITALTGTGLFSIALALLAFDMAGGEAGAVLGTALALKMIAYVGVAPVVGGIAHALPRKATMIGLDIMRAGFVCLMPWVTEVWQILVLIFLVNGASAAFKPIYQGVIPDLLPDKAHYAKALSMFRVAYDMENLLSPALTALLLGIMTFKGLFWVTGAAFLVSAILVALSCFPVSGKAEREERVRENILFGVRTYLLTPRLRGVLALYVGIASASAMTIVNTVVYVQDHLGMSETDTATAMMAVGFGSMVTAMLLPGLMRRLRNRTTMLVGGVVLVVGMGLGVTFPGFGMLLAIWFLLGIGLSMTQTPTGQVIIDSCRDGDRTALFSANFALSHACWFFAYLAAGHIGARYGLETAFALLTATTVVSVIVALLLWPRREVERLEHLHAHVEHSHWHVHDDEHHHHAHAPEDEPLDPSTPHRHRHVHEEVRHTHRFVIDLHHPRWPRPDGGRG